jgi:hypothetical protein
MKRVFLLIVVPALLVAMGFAQAPVASGNADQINTRGCVGGSDGNYTVLENNTGKTFKMEVRPSRCFIGRSSPNAGGFPKIPSLSVVPCRG